jgi:hypothetical protein
VSAHVEVKPVGSALVGAEAAVGGVGKLEHLVVAFLPGSADDGLAPSRYRIYHLGIRLAVSIVPLHPGGSGDKAASSEPAPEIQI